MTIKSAAKLRGKKITIDLTGSQGNASNLLGTAEKLAKQLGKDGKGIINRMKSGNYDNLIKIFDEEFGNYVNLYR